MHLKKNNFNVHIYLFSGDELGGNAALFLCLLGQSLNCQLSLGDPGAQHAHFKQKLICSVLGLGKIIYEKHNEQDVTAVPVQPWSEGEAIS